MGYAVISALSNLEDIAEDNKNTESYGLENVNKRYNIDCPRNSFLRFSHSCDSTQAISLSICLARPQCSESSERIARLFL